MSHTSLSLTGAAEKEYQRLKRAHPDKSASDIFLMLTHRSKTPGERLAMHYREGLRSALPDVTDPGAQELLTWLPQVLTDIANNAYRAPDVYKAWAAALQTNRRVCFTPTCERAALTKYDGLCAGCYARETRNGSTPSESEVAQ